jgi:hypothetical protein
MVADDYELVYRLFFIRCETHNTPYIHLMWDSKYTTSHPTQLGYA